LFWVEGVVEMGTGNSKSESGIDNPVGQFLFVLEVLGLGPSVLFVFRSQFEVQVLDEVLEGGHEFR
jgi:hypothetical protein